MGAEDTEAVAPPGLTYNSRRAGSGRLPLAPDPPIPRRSRPPSATLTMSWRWRKGCGRFHAGRNFACRSAPPWRPCPGGRLGAAAPCTGHDRWAEAATTGVRSAGSPSPGRSPLLRAPPGGSSEFRAPDAGAGRAAVLQMRGALLAPSPPCPESARVWPRPPPPLIAGWQSPRPAAGAAGGRGEARGIPLGEPGLPHPARTLACAAGRRGWSTTWAA